MEVPSPAVVLSLDALLSIIVLASHAQRFCPHVYHAFSCLAFYVPVPSDVIPNVTSYYIASVPSIGILSTYLQHLDIRYNVGNQSYGYM